MHGLGNARALAPEQQDLVVAECVLEVGALCGGRQQYQRHAFAQTPLLESEKRRVPGEGDLVEVVHAGPTEGAIGHREAGRLDDMHLNAEAGAEPENRPGILRDVRYVNGVTDGGTVNFNAFAQSGLYR